MDFAERVLAVSVTVAMGCALFCGGHAWAQKYTEVEVNATIASKVDDYTVSMKYEQSYDEIVKRLEAKRVERDEVIRRRQSVWDSETANIATQDEIIAYYEALLTELTEQGYKPKPAPVVEEVIEQ